jgi:signal-transduction protein with cAMP-binding, CBS, and nucleotidyltransferase domain
MLSSKVSEIMTTSLTAAPVSSTILDVLKTMSAQDIGRIIITDNEVPVGIFTEKDVLRRVLHRELDLEKTSIKEVMTAPLHTVREETHIVEAFGRMFRGKYRHLLVRGRRGRIIGIVSMRRILKLAVELGQGMSETQTLGSISMAPAHTVDQSTSVYDTISAMVERNATAVVVTDGENLKGIFTERDALKRVAIQQINSKQTAVKEIMTAPLITMPSSALVGDALAEMYRRDIRNMPVRGDHDKLVGMLSMPEILQYARAFNIDEQVRRAWKEVAEFMESEDQYTPG